MARLRSNRWYSSGGQGRSRASVALQSSGTKRILSLCMLLALVLVMMQKASDPKHLRNAFSALGVPFEEQFQPETPAEESSPGKLGRSQNALHQDQPASMAPPSPEELRWMATCDDLVPRLLADANSVELISLSERWFTLNPTRQADRAEDSQVEVSNPAELTFETQSPQPHKSSEAWRKLQQQTEVKLAEITQQLNDLPDDERGTWQAQLSRFESEWGNLWESVAAHVASTDAPQTHPPTTSTASTPTATRALPTLSPPLIRAIDKRLDTALMAAMRDAAPWTKSESIPFLRLLQRTNLLRVNQPSAEPPLLSTLQLEAESAIFRGQPVRYRGEVRLVEYVERGQNDFGIEGYWSMWLRGDDRAVQPVAVYSTQSIGRQLQQTLEAGETPRIEVLGILGKRLAYASQAKVEVAPTIFAASILQFASDETTATTGKPSSQQNFGWAIAIGLLLAGLVLTPILANWKRRPVQPLRRTKSTHLMLLVALGLPFTALPAVAQSTPETPPWARSKQVDPVREVLSARLADSYAADDVANLLEYLAGDAQVIPDAALKTMQVLRQVGWSRLEQRPLQIEFADGKLRAEVAELKGMVRLAMPAVLDEAQQLWFFEDNQGQLFRIDVEQDQESTAAHIATPNRMVTVFCERVPTAWLTSARLKLPVSLKGLRLSLLDDDNNPRILCWFAEKPQWRIPEDFVEDGLNPQLTPIELALGKLGWDIANFDTVRSRNQQPIQAEEAEAFLSLLRILDPPVDLRGKNASVIEALAKPIELVGAEVRWRVRLVNGSVVEVTSAAEQAALGAKSYMQFDGMVDMGNQVVHYQLGGAQAGTHDFEREFPVTIVMRTPPAFLSAPNANEKNFDIGQYVEVSGIFYRQWSYQSELLERQNATARQAAPLVVANQIFTAVPTIPQNQSPIGWFSYALCLATLLVAGGILFSFFQGDRRLRRRKIL